MTEEHGGGERGRDPTNDDETAGRSPLSSIWGDHETRRLRCRVNGAVVPLGLVLLLLLRMTPPAISALQVLATLGRKTPTLFCPSKSVGCLGLDKMPTRGRVVVNVLLGLLG